MTDKVDRIAKTIVPSSIKSFIKTTREVADAMEAMEASTPLEGQSVGAAKILMKYNLV